MARKYYTLCVWEDEHGVWLDEFGSCKKAEVMEEKEGYDLPKGWLAIVTSDESAEGMMAARDALPAPKSRKG